ncbi:radical SAM protein [Clostridium cellulovorans]|uniref:Radical SAM domain protein n=1 Tax=Clostridium cellulovorans (strain ATCC 35296 / DSM 3052 / OCM 3 / 743B) TaxID=573061 RepID=D9SX22_CLOC7|nr:radical SAM protein [Clostridium cellulovorans]ADL51383.1 Radical SAM domain protein [Clostridium cellulovorans 743B]
MNKLSVVDIQIIDKCNRKCRYCFGPRPNKDILSYDTIRNILDEMSLNQINNLSITGGEPLMHPDIKGILSYAKEKDFNISLSTNTDFFKNNTELLKYIDILGIPLDSSVMEEHDRVRGNGSYNSVIDTIKYIEHNGSCDVRIGTVLSNNNKKDIKSIANIIKKYECIKVWRIYDELKYGYKNDKLIIENQINENIMMEVSKMLNKKEVTYVSRRNRNLGYFIIEPDGQVFMPMISEKRDYKNYIGDIYRDSFKKLLKVWNKLCDANNHTNMNLNIFKEINNGK